ncbi:MAG TPA: VWA domain-containing protein [Candidatus Solibacter sp.]|nr:VWA domain-containing protein [Candidatus Solibacter sp.]
MKPLAGLKAGRIAALLCLLLVPLALASPDPSQTPEIRVTTHLVQIGIIVRDKNGPVSNLTKDDFVVLDGGKPQKIDIFSVESSQSPSPAAPEQPLPPNTFSDLPQYSAAKPRSVTIVLLDNLNTLSGSTPQLYENTPFWLEDHALANAKQHLIEFLQQLDPNDRIAIYGLTDSLHVLCDFTCNRPDLLAVVTKYDPTSKTQRQLVDPGAIHTPQGTGGDATFDELTNAAMQRMAAMNNQVRAQSTFAALTAIADHVADIPGRKNLLWLTANLPFSGEAIARILGRANIAAYPVDARGLLPRMPFTSADDIEPSEAGATAALGVDSSPANSDQPTGIDAMQKMAEVTGGRAFVNTNDLTGAIRSAVEDSALTYTLGFYVDSNSLDGKFHELKVRVKDSGLTLRYPKGYFAFKDSSATKDERHNNFLAALHSPLDSSAIPMQVKVDRANQPAPNSLILFGSVNIRGVYLPQSGQSHVGALDIAVIEQDKTGKVLHQSTNRINLRFTDEQYAATLNSGITFRKSVQPATGATILRVLVQDPVTAAIGSLVIPLSRVN